MLSLLLASLSRSHKSAALPLSPRLQQRTLVQGAFDLLREPTPDLLLSNAGDQALGLAIEQGDVCQVGKIQHGQMFPSFGPESVQQGQKKSAILNTPTPPLQGSLKGLEVECVIQGAHSFGGALPVEDEQRS